jgi:hypothetical protein
MRARCGFLPELGAAFALYAISLFAGWPLWSVLLLALWLFALAAAEGELRRIERQLDEVHVAQEVVRLALCCRLYAPGRDAKGPAC